MPNQSEGDKSGGQDFRSIGGKKIDFPVKIEDERKIGQIVELCSRYGITVKSLDRLSSRQLGGSLGVFTDLKLPHVRTAGGPATGGVERLLYFLPDYVINFGKVGELNNIIEELNSWLKNPTSIRTAGGPQFVDSRKPNAEDIEKIQKTLDFLIEAVAIIA